MQTDGDWCQANTEEQNAWISNLIWDKMELKTKKNWGTKNYFRDWKYISTINIYAPNTIALDYKKQ